MIKNAEILKIVSQIILVQSSIFTDYINMNKEPDKKSREKWANTLSGMKEHLDEVIKDLREDK